MKLHSSASCECAVHCSIPRCLLIAVSYHSYVSRPWFPPPKNDTSSFLQTCSSRNIICNMCPLLSSSPQTQCYLRPSGCCFSAATSLPIPAASLLPAAMPLLSSFTAAASAAAFACPCPCFEAAAAAAAAAGASAASPSREMPASWQPSRTQSGTSPRGNCRATNRRTNSGYRCSLMACRISADRRCRAGQGRARCMSKRVEHGVGARRSARAAACSTASLTALQAWCGARPWLQSKAAAPSPRPPPSCMRCCGR